VKTTIDIPEPLYKRAKIHAVERGQTLRDLVLRALEAELTVSEAASTSGRSFSERRRLLPGFQEAAQAGAYRMPPGATDVTSLISEDRNGR